MSSIEPSKTWLFSQTYKKNWHFIDNITPIIADIPDYNDKKNRNIVTFHCNVLEDTHFSV